MKKIIEAGDLPVDEEVSLKRGVFGWRVVHPIKTKEGKLNWINLFIGGWGNLVVLLLLLAVVLSFFYIYEHDTQEMQKVVENPCYYCDKMIDDGTGRQALLNGFDTQIEDAEN